MTLPGKGAANQVSELFLQKVLKVSTLNVFVLKKKKSFNFSYCTAGIVLVLFSNLNIFRGGTVLAL